MDVRVGDILEMKKAHPCGSKRWEVKRIGMDFRLICQGRPHSVADALHPRRTAEGTQIYQAEYQ